MTERRIHFITMDAPNLFASNDEFVKRFQEMLPGNLHGLYGQDINLAFYEQHQPNFLDNKVTIRLVVQATD